MILFNAYSKLEQNFLNLLYRRSSCTISLSKPFSPKLTTLSSSNTINCCGFFFLFLNFIYWNDIKCILFCGWLFPLNIMFLRFIHIVVYCNISFLLVQYSIIQIHHYLVIQFVVEHLDCLQFLAMWILLYEHCYTCVFSSVHSLSCVWLCNPMDAARQASLSITNSRSLVKLMSLKSVMSSNHLILCCPLLLLPSSISGEYITKSEIVKSCDVSMSKLSFS